MTQEQYKIRFSFTVNYDDMDWGIKDNSWVGTSEITRWKDQPFDIQEIQEEAYKIVKEEAYDNWGDIKINSISCYSFIKEEYIEELDFEK